jgi:hypothetical protein
MKQTALRRCLLLLCFLACSAQAEIRALVVETDPPGEAVTLGRDEVLWVRIAYTTDEPVRIWARPYLGGQEYPVQGNPSLMHTGAGYALGWFSFHQAAQADEIRITVGTGASSQPLEVARHPVRLTATGQPGAARTAAPWVDELRREAEAKGRLERKRIASQPASTGDTALTYALMLLVAAVVFGVPALLVLAVRKTSWTREWMPYAAAALSGLTVCLAISQASGRKEAWDSDLYFTIGMPVMVLAIFALSYFFPQRAWRWTLSMAIGQSIAMLLGGNSLSLWPLAIIAMLFFSLPQFAFGFAGSWLARRNAA